MLNLCTVSYSELYVYLGVMEWTPRDPGKITRQGRALKSAFIVSIAVSGSELIPKHSITKWFGCQQLKVLWV